MSWTAGWNTPGCLPEMEPFSGADWEDARDFLAGEASLADENDDSSELKLLVRELNDAEENKPFSAIADGCAWWIEYDDSDAQQLYLGDGTFADNH